MRDRIIEGDLEFMKWEFLLGMMMWDIVEFSIFLICGKYYFRDYKKVIMKFLFL